MNQNDILTLARAGFTAEQIAAMNVINQSTQQVVANPVQPVVTQPSQLSVTQPTIPIMAQPSNNPLDQISQQIQQLTQSVQHGNIMTNNQPQPETVDDILASIINPKEVIK